MSDGWPFLIAGGVSAGYRVLLAPEFLLANQDLHVLDSLPLSDQDEQARIVEVATSTGPRMSVVYLTHLATAEDVDNRKAPRDEHGRRLAWICGFITDQPLPNGATPADITTSLAAAKGTYNRFLADELHFPTQASEAFPLSIATATGTVSSNQTQPTDTRPTRPHPRLTPGIITILAIVGLLIVVWRALHRY
jgi:hypothetical protein